MFLSGWRIKLRAITRHLSLAGPTTKLTGQPNNGKALPIAVAYSHKGTAQGDFTCPKI